MAKKGKNPSAFELMGFIMISNLENFKGSRAYVKFTNVQFRHKE